MNRGASWDTIRSSSALGSYFCGATRVEFTWGSRYTRENQNSERRGEFTRRRVCQSNSTSGRNVKWCLCEFADRLWIVCSVLSFTYGICFNRYMGKEYCNRYFSAMAILWEIKWAVFLSLGVNAISLSDISSWSRSAANINEDSIPS